MLLLFGLCILFKVLAAEDCIANQQSTTSLTAPSFYEAFPKGSKRLPFNAICQWNITAPVGKVVQIWVNKAKFNNPCDGEYLRIHDGPRKSTDIIAEYCNRVISSKTSHYFYSTGRSLFLDVKTGVKNSTRLDVYYKAVNFQDCSLNRTLDAPESPTENKFSSPYYPNGYPVNMTCGWYITAPEDHIVKLHLTSQFSSLIPSGDGMVVYDVDGSEFSINSILLRTDSMYTSILYSKFHTLYVLFKSDDKPQSDYTKGISVSYTAIKTVHPCSSSNSEEENTHIIFREPSGTFKTPGYPSNYPTDLIHQCFWKIIAPKGQVVRLDFLDFRMPLLYCVDIKNSINKNDAVKISRCRRQNPFTVYSAGRELSLNVPEVYIAESSNRGFIANYSFVPAGLSSGTCVLKDNSVIHMAADEERSFATPGDPSSSGTGSCSWNITVPPGKFIKLDFLGFMGLCSDNYAEVFDVTNSKVLMEKFCSEKTVYSKGNDVLVKYTRQKATYSSVGFFATYVAAPAKYSCTREYPYVYNLTDETGEFASFNYPVAYANGVRCSWALEFPVGYRAQVTFHSFDLQRTQDCEADYVEVKKGYKMEWSSPVGKFCGPWIPNTLTLNSNMYVNFVTDSSESYPGFHASYKVSPNPAMGPCKIQGVDNVIPLSGETGRLFSPLHPDAYPPDMMCTWIITVPEGRFVKLSIKSFNLEKTCNGPVLEIRDGLTSSSNVLKSFCGGDFEPSVFSSGRHLWIRFQTPGDNHLLGNGFDATYEAVTQLPAPFSCTGGRRDIKLGAEPGTLASYNYPLPYEGNVECTWVIQVDSKYEVKLSFDSFNLSKSDYCFEDYVKILSPYETFCGSEKPESVTSYESELTVVFKSSGKTKYPGFKAHCERKKTPMPVIIIVGICLGAAFVVCLVIAVSYKCWKKRKQANAAREGIRWYKAESAPLHEQSTVL